MGSQLALEREKRTFLFFSFTEIWRRKKWHAGVKSICLAGLWWFKVAFFFELLFLKSGSARAHFLKTVIANDVVWDARVALVGGRGSLLFCIRFEHEEAPAQRKATGSSGRHGCTPASIYLALLSIKYAHIFALFVLDFLHFSGAFFALSRWHFVH